MKSHPALPAEAKPAEPSPHVQNAQGSVAAALILALTPIVAVYAMLLREMRSVPMFDDFQAIISFAVIFQHLPSFGSKLLFILAAQHDEYKLIFEHAIVALQLAVLGQVHLGALILMADLALLGILLLLWTQAFPAEASLSRRLFLFAPVCYLLMQLNYVENQDWAMCGMQTFPVLLFTLLSLYCILQGGSRAAGLGCLCAWLGCLSSANGFLIAPIGLWILVLGRRWRWSVAWTFSFSIALAMYLYRYIPITRPGYDPNVGFGLKIVYFFSFLGAAVENLHHFPVHYGAVLLGIGIFATFVAAIRARFYRSQPFIFYAAVWFLLSAALVTQVRIGLGFNTSLTLRYKIYSDLLLIFCYLYWTSRFELPSISPKTRRRFYAASLTAAILLSASSDLFGYRFLHTRRIREEAGLDLYAADPAKNVPEVTFTEDVITSGEPEFARQVLNQAIAEHLYVLPPSGKR